MSKKQDRHCLVGLLGEQYVAGILVLKGSFVLRGGPADLLVDNVTVEIKTARLRPYKRGRRSGYQFCINRAGRNGLQADYLVLVCWSAKWEKDAFIIPADQLNGQRRITITGKPQDYNGRYKQWLNRWDLLRKTED